MAKARAGIEGTIDSVSMQHLCRPAVKVKPPKRAAILGLTLIAEAIKNGVLLIYLDKQGGLKDEWRKTCGDDLISQLIILWTDLNGIKFCEASGAINPPTLSKKLRQLGFRDAGDKLIVRIGLGAVATCGVPEFWIATNDGDFWHPQDLTLKGVANAPVAGALACSQLRVELLRSFFDELHRQLAA